MKVRILITVAIAMLVGMVFAQTGVDLFDPSTWFVSQEAIFAAAALITPWITKIFTALGKDWFNTDGKATVWLSLVVASVIAGVGGFLSIGFLADGFGLSGALNAVFLTVIAFLASNGMAKNERQVATAAMTRSIQAMKE